MTDQELIQLLDQRSAEQWPPDQLVLLRRRVRESPAVREAFLARLRLEEALQGHLARPPYTTAALSAGVAALLAQGVSAGLTRAAAWWWGTLGTAALVATVSVGTWTLRNQRPEKPPTPSVVQQRDTLPLVAPELSDPHHAQKLAEVARSPSDDVPQGFARHWDPQSASQDADLPWPAPMGTLPLVAPGPERPGGP